MTDIRIKQLKLENFKSHKALCLEFEGANASIYGDNATGKTSIYDALTWLLFGKDSAGNGEKNIEIKPLDETGAVRDHLAVTAVEAVLLVNSEEVTLRRTYKEVWTTKRGSSQATYDGNTSDYYVDGVPCKRNAFQEKVSELVDENTFRMLTSVSYFANGISWQERRERLFDVAGVQNDQDILATDQRFVPLIESMGKLSIDDYKKKLLAEKRKFVGTKSEIPARISECQKTIEDMRDLDFAGAKAEVDALNDKKEKLAAQILAIDQDSAAGQKRMEIREAQMELVSLENENKVFRAGQQGATTDVYGLNLRITSLRRQITGKQASLDNETTYIPQLDKQIAAARNEWKTVNAESFSATACPTCGQALPADQLKAAKEQFEADKKKRLDRILADANRHKEYKAQAEARMTRVKEEIAQLNSEIDELQAQIQAAENIKVEIVDMADYAERKQGIQGRIDSLNEGLLEIMEASASVRDSLQEQLAEVNRLININLGVLSKESVLEYSRQRVEQLREDAKNTAECLDAIESMLFLMDEYSRYKTRFVEESVNRMFRIARFRLFREQANGGVEDRCDVVYDGISYISVNNGMKINLGIDIINTLSMAYGVRVPLFVDNAESVTKLEQCGSQIIRLVVSEKDKELVVQYES